MKIQLYVKVYLISILPKYALNNFIFKMVYHPRIIHESNKKDHFLESCEHCEDLFSNWGMHLQFHNHAQFPFTSHKLTKIMSICVRIFLFVSYQLDCMFLY